MRIGSIARLFGLVLSIAMARTVLCGELVVTTKPRDPRTHAREIVVALRAADDPARQRLISTRVGDTQGIRIDDGTWHVAVATAGVWSPVRIIDVREGIAASAELPVLASGKARARIVLPPASKEVDEVKVYFQQSADVPDPDFDGEHTASAEPDGDRIAFELPAGTHDLAFRIAGHSSVFRWDHKVVANQERDLGVLQFRRGTTISGRLDIGSVPKGDLRNVRVVLRPHDPAPVDEQSQRKGGLRTLSAEVTRRGFFHFAVQPGAYVLEAVAGRYRSAEHLVEVSEKAEGVLNETLRLQEPRSLRVHVDPPLDPTGKPWHVSLLGPTTPLTRQVSGAGLVQFEDLLALPYRLDVGRGQSDAWHSESVDLRDISSVDVSIPLTRVTGRVLIGAEPLAGATLSFLDAGRIIRVRSRAEGRFAADLPMETANAAWERVEIASNRPLIRTAVDDLRIEDGEVTIRIPNRTVLGEVRDAAGQPARATVTVHASSGAFQVDSDEGVFQLAGLPAGTISFEAFSVAGMTSRKVEAVLDEDESSSANVRLVLEASDELKGIVQAPHGALTGAAVWCAPSMLSPVVVRIPTDLDGAFRFAKARSVEWMTCTVAAPTFATRLFRVSATRSEPLPVLMTQNGATLVMTVPKPDAGRQPFLFHQNAAIPVNAFAYLASAQSNGSEIVAYVEEGDWSLCMWNDGDVAAAESGHPPMLHCRTTRAVPGARTQLTF